MQKFFAVLLVISLASLVSSQDLFSFKEPTESLFVSAWEYQGKFSDLQIEINEKVYEIQTSVSKVLAITTNKTLTQIDDNAKSFVELDETVREVLNPLMPDGCISDLLEILDGVTHMSGFDSSNCLRHYDVSLQAEIANFTEALATYGNLSAEIQQIVVRAFIGKNAFKVPKEIEERFVSAWNIVSTEWYKVRSSYATHVENFQNNINGFNNQLEQCFSSLQLEYDESYTKVNKKRLVCQEFTRSARAFVEGNRFNIAEFLPQAK